MLGFLKEDLSVGMVGIVVEREMWDGVIVVGDKL